VINLDTTLSQQLLDVAIREPITQIPAHRDRDHLGRKPETSEGRPGNWSRTPASGEPHRPILPDPQSTDATPPDALSVALRADGYD
jgi:hypothetical protein